MSDRRVEFSEKIRVKRLALAGFKCEGEVQGDDGAKTRCNAALTKTRVEFDHHVAAELDGPATLANCRALCKVCHRAKYPADAAKIAQAKRREIRDVGAKKPGSLSSDTPDKPAYVPAVGVSNIARRFRIK